MKSTKKEKALALLELVCGVVFLVVNYPVPHMYEIGSTADRMFWLFIFISSFFAVVNLIEYFFSAEGIRGLAFLALLFFYISLVLAVFLTVRNLIQEGPGFLLPSSSGVDWIIVLLYMGAYMFWIFSGILLRSEKIIKIAKLKKIQSTTETETK
jgi:hypothetical protein